MMEWIRADEQYPDSKLQVLVVCLEEMMDMGKLKPRPTVRVGYTRGEGEGWFDWYSDKHIVPTHWLPMSVLPELLEEE